MINWDGRGREGDNHPVEFNSPDVLGAGSFNSDDLHIPELKDGYNYSITLNGADRAGNVATPAELTDIHIDLTPPEFTALLPESGALSRMLKWDGPCQRISLQAKYFSSTWGLNPNWKQI